MISKKDSFHFLIAALSRLDKAKLELNDDDLSYEIFEELDMEAISFLHEWTVDRLIKENLIPELLREKILNLRESIIKAMEVKHSIEEYRHDPEWMEIRERGSNLLKEIKSFADKI